DATTAEQGIPLLPLQSTDMSARSKCVPTRIDPGVVADPVKKPFGLQRNRSWPIRKLWARFLPLVSPRSALCSKLPIARRVYGPTFHTTPGPNAVVNPSPTVSLPVSNIVRLPPSP